MRRGAAHASEQAGAGFLAYVSAEVSTRPQSPICRRLGERYIGMWSQAPGLAQIEYNVVRWLCDVFGLGPEARGILTSAARWRTSRR